jgi:hypothetical protein
MKKDPTSCFQRFLTFEGDEAAGGDQVCRPFDTEQVHIHAARGLPTLKRKVQYTCGKNLKRGTRRGRKVESKTNG